MRKEQDGNVGGYVHRHLSQLKVLTRLVDHELGAAKPGNDITVDRELLENLLDTIEIFVEDLSQLEPRKKAARNVGDQEGKQTVTRLN